MHHIRHLSKDQKLKPIIKLIGKIELNKESGIYESLVSSVISQQLSTKVAKVFHQRFLELHNNTHPSPSQLLQTPIEKLRSIGLSNSKANYIQNIARFAIDQGLQFSKLSKLTNEDIISYFTRIKGVGQWTAEMILMFTMGREDVFPVDDLGIQNAMIKLYGLRIKDKKKLKTKMLQLAKDWSPYRTYAAMYLWKWKDTVK